MSVQGDEPGAKFEDLFDDLDKFFTPIERSGGDEVVRASDEPPPRSEEVSGGGEANHMDGPETGEPHELTVDDLKKAQTEYSELPIADDPDPESEGPPPAGSADEEPSETAPDAPPAAPSPSADESGAEQDDDWGEPAITEIEAAADKLAED